MKRLKLVLVVMLIAAVAAIKFLPWWASAGLFITLALASLKLGG